MVEFLVKELEVRLELDHLYKVLDWCLQVHQQLSTVTVHSIFRPDLDFKTWENEEVLKSGGDTTIYIKNYMGSPIFIELTLFQ